MATIPGPLESDAEDVSLALEVAQTQWARGDVDEALKWLRKSADAAFEAEDDKRGMELSKIAVELATESKEQRKKPKATLPRVNAQMQSPPPAPRRTPPPPPKAASPGRAASRPSAEKALETTGTRRTAEAGHAARRASRVGPEDAPLRRPPRAAMPDGAVSGRHQDPAAPGVERVSDEWLLVPEDSLLDIEETRERASKPAPGRIADENMANARVADPQLAAMDTAARSPRKREEPRPSKPPPGDSKTIRAALGVPSTRAVRVAASRAPDGRAVVRVLDAQGLRPGEHDAMLVALTGDGDLRDLFR